MFNSLQWKRLPRLLGNEEGTAIVAALLILMLLTFVALTATDTTIDEKAMVRSEAIFEHNFAQAESAALEGLQKLASKNNDEIEDLLPGRMDPLGASDNKELLQDSESDERGDIFDIIDKNSNARIDKGDSLEVSGLSANAFRTAVLLPIATGDSLSVTGTKSRLYRYYIFGLSEDLGGKALILNGYKRRIDH